MFYNVTYLQIRRAYERHYNKSMPKNISYESIALQMSLELTSECYSKLVQNESNNPDSAYEPLQLKKD